MLKSSFSKYFLGLFSIEHCIQLLQLLRRSKLLISERILQPQSPFRNTVSKMKHAPFFFVHSSEENA